MRAMVLKHVASQPLYQHTPACRAYVDDHDSHRCHLDVAIRPSQTSWEERTFEEPETEGENPERQRSIAPDVEADSRENRTRDLGEK